MIEITLGANDVNRRFDRFLHAHLSQAPKSLVYKLLRKKRIKLNGAKALGSEITALGDKITFYLSQETYENFTMKEAKVFKNWGTIDIIYEDDNVLVVNKPAGLLTHANSPSPQDTLLDRVAYYLNSSCAAACNRLDRNTSGLVIFGKNVPALQALNAAFAERKVDKTYLALVHGKLVGQAKLKGYIYKDQVRNQSYITDTPSDDSQYIHTEYESCEFSESSENFSLLRVKIHTGRSHQIRVQFAALGHPLVGDTKYGGKVFGGGRRGQMLHCLSIRILEIGGALEYLSGKEWQAPKPAEFKKF